MNVRTRFNIGFLVVLVAISLLVIGLPTAQISAEEVEKVDLYTYTSPSSGATAATDKNLGQRFVVPTGKALKSVNFFEIATYAATNVYPLELKLYAWKTDFASTIAGTVLDSYQKAEQHDNDPVDFVLDTPLAAGEYFILFKGNVDNQIATQYYSKQGDTTLFVNGVELAGMSSSISIGLLNASTTTAAPTEAPTAAPTEAPTAAPTAAPISYVELYTYTSPSSGATAATDKNLGQRFVVPEGKFLKSVNFYEIATYDDANVYPLDVKIYAWDTDFTTTIGGTVLASYHKDEQHNNDPVDFVLKNTLPAGEYLVFFKGDVDNQIATQYYAKQDTDTTLFVNGTELAGMSASITIGLASQEENANTSDSSAIFAVLVVMIAASAILFKKKVFN